ncbi:hypothetical protein DEU52_103267 [Ensifer adhaerens]|nr:hypothetical protein DEU52_103267 [Ensifer adhaerens]
MKEMLAMNRLIDAKAARSRTKSVITWLLFRYVVTLFHFCSRVKQCTGILFTMVNIAPECRLTDDEAA